MGLRERGFQPTRTKKARGWGGLRLRSEAENNSKGDGCRIDVAFPETSHIGDDERRHAPLDGGRLSKTRERTSSTVIRYSSDGVATDEDGDL